MRRAAGHFNILLRVHDGLDRRLDRFHHHILRHGRHILLIKHLLRQKWDMDKTAAFPRIPGRQQMTHTVSHMIAHEGTRRIGNTGPSQHTQKTFYYPPNLITRP